MIYMDDCGHVHDTTESSEHRWEDRVAPLHVVCTQDTHIKFTYKLLLDRRVALHSVLFDSGRVEDFLYEIHDGGSAAMRAAVTMIEDAGDYLNELGAARESSEGLSAADFLKGLEHDMASGLH